MNCERCEEQLSALIDRELDDTQSAEVYAHLGTCLSCRAFLSSTEHIRSALSAHTDPVPASLDARIRSIPNVEGRRAFSSTLRQSMMWWKRRLAIPAPAFGLLVLMLLMSAAMIVGLLRTTLTPSETTPSSVVYIMSLSPIEVQAQRINDSPHIQ